MQKFVKFHGKFSQMDNEICSRENYFRVTQSSNKIKMSVLLMIFLEKQRILNHRQITRQFTVKSHEF